MLQVKRILVLQNVISTNTMLRHSSMALLFRNIGLQLKSKLSSKNYVYLHFEKSSFVCLRQDLTMKLLLAWNTAHSPGWLWTHSNLPAFHVFWHFRYKPQWRFPLLKYSAKSWIQGFIHALFVLIKIKYSNCFIWASGSGFSSPFFNSFTQVYLAETKLTK